MGLDGEEEFWSVDPVGALEKINNTECYTEKKTISELMNYLLQEGFVFLSVDIDSDSPGSKKTERASRQNTPEPRTSAV